VQDLAKLGYVEGQNTIFEARSAKGDDRLLPGLAAELVALKPNVILAVSTPPTMALKESGTSIPIVFCQLGGDPVGLGLVESISRPGGNITGIAGNYVDVAAKRLQLLKEIAPSIVRVAVLLNPLSAGAVAIAGEIEKASHALAIEAVAIEFKRGEDLPEAIERATQLQAQAMIIAADVVSIINRKTIIDLSLKEKLPTMYNQPIEVIDGGLISYGPDAKVQWSRAAYYLDQILRGTKPADLPVEQATSLTLTINRKTAEALGLTIPLAIWARADEVIE
jgi:putative ABC transport system substrate-binding protein